MRKCVRCNTEMIDNLDVSITNGSYGVCIKEKGLFSDEELDTKIFIYERNDPNDDHYYIKYLSKTLPIKIYYDYYEDDMSINAVFAPDKLDRVIPAVKKSIKILENMNKKFKQIMEHLEDFEKLSAI